MNWEKIKTDYPKAYNKYIVWNCAKNPNCLSKECYDFNIRDLFDFFDENDIYVDIEWVYLDNKLTFNFNMLDRFNEHKRIDFNPRRTRIQAEEMAFTQAFEILNNKLK